MKRTLTILSLYPAQMNVYGDRGNVLVLRRRLEWRGYRANILELHPGESLPRDIDLIIGGGGQDRGQVAIQPDLLRHRNDLRAMAEDGTPMLMVCGLYQLFGRSLRVTDGTQLTGIGIYDLETQPAPRRSIGNVTAETTEFGTLVGYENHAGATTLGPGTPALATVAPGQGNNGIDRTEGARRWSTFGTYLHGPLLPRNPLFADHLIRIALERRFGRVELSELSHAAEQLARASGGRRR
ncbi:glutamine amidotransferase [Leifsonia shinshuensis]|uniref:type 1 glutamine amidotransferase n=1 Tax=Leifsonia shinshuensis TaxID=150026 RepID=UPI001F50D971|nr:glutamine amidotransferase [Leifsonia shinshuensis]MCI0156517.1 glutamine amidotransferase [Leifsonia shinshuensis]